MSLFNTKIFCKIEKFSLAELGRIRQYLGEDLELYVKIFHETAMYCCELVDEEVRLNISLHEVLLNVCLHSMLKDYHMSFPSFSKGDGSSQAY